jgi:sensor histidine kinase regulating citrate/malate metabolism
VLVDKAWVAAERDVAFTVIDTTQDGTTAASPDDLVTLLGNLVDNALDAVTSGREADPAAPAEVRVRLATEDDRLVLEVADSGPGVPADAGADIFEHGFSTKPAAPDRPRGIGLALVSRVARRLGGTVDLTPGSPGTVFTVRIPAVRPGPRPSPPSVPTASAGPPPPA